MCNQKESNIYVPLLYRDMLTKTRACDIKLMQFLSTYNILLKAMLLYRLWQPLAHHGRDEIVVILQATS